MRIEQKKATIIIYVAFHRVVLWVPSGFLSLINEGSISTVILHHHA